MDIEILPRQDQLTEKEEQIMLLDKLAYLRRRREVVLDDLVALDEEIEKLAIALSQPI